jgi:hypothetical protein
MIFLARACGSISTVYSIACLLLDKNGLLPLPPCGLCTSRRTISSSGSWHIIPPRKPTQLTCRYQQQTTYTNIYVRNDECAATVCIKAEVSVRPWKQLKSNRILQRRVTKVLRVARIGECAN